MASEGRGDAVRFATGEAGLLHDCGDAGCRYSHKVWRYWSVDPEDDLPLGAPYVALRTGQHAGFPASASFRSSCWHDGSDHDFLECTCGVRGAVDASTLASAMLAEHRFRHGVAERMAGPSVPADVVADLFGTTPGDDDAFEKWCAHLDRIAVGCFGVYGRLAGGATDDQGGIIRADCGEIFGPIFLPATLAEHRQRIADVYDVPVHVKPASTGPELFASFLDPELRRICQACGERTRVRDGLCRDPQPCYERTLRRLQLEGKL